MAYLTNLRWRDEPWSPEPAAEPLPLIHAAVVAHAEYPVSTMKTVSQLQDEHTAWVAKNFGTSRDARHPAMGIVEEVGELFHAVLKSEQGIRGTREEHEAAIKDAVGDVCIYAIDYTTRLGLRLASVLKSESFEVEIKLDDPLCLAVKSAAQAYRAATQETGAAATVIGAEAVDLLTVAMAALCNAHGWSLHAIVVETWESVSKRDWTRNPESGGAT